MNHPDTTARYISPELGRGCVAAALLPEGTITWVLDELDQLLSPETMAAMSPALRDGLISQDICLTRQGLRILPWDEACRCMNHCCAANIGYGGWPFAIALCDIHPGETLTLDYGRIPGFADIDGHRASIYLDSCQCGAQNCRHTITPDDVLFYGERWAAEFEKSFRKIQDVPQPLWGLLSDVDRREIGNALSGTAEVPSLARWYHAGARLPLDSSLSYRSTQVGVQPGFENKKEPTLANRRH